MIAFSYCDFSGLFGLSCRYRRSAESSSWELPAFCAAVASSGRYVALRGWILTAVWYALTAAVDAAIAFWYSAEVWADAACDHSAALDHPLSPLIVGVRAYGAWVRGEFEQACPLGRLHCFPCDREPLGCAPQQRRVTERFSRRHQQQ